VTKQLLTNLAVIKQLLTSASRLQLVWRDGGPAKLINEHRTPTTSDSVTVFGDR